MALVYRTDDGSRWGFGKGANLTPTEADLNFWQLHARVLELETNPVEANNIESFEVIGNEFYVHMTDHSVIGPYPLPVAQWNFRGEWQSAILYLKMDVITKNGSLYLVIFDHTSDTVFDPGENDGLGNNYYGLILAPPTIPPFTVIKTIADHTYELLAEDAGKYIRFTNTSSIAVVILTNANEPIPVGTEISGRGVTLAVTIVPESGSVTLNTPAGFQPVTYGGHASFTVKKIATNEWDLMGLLTPEI
jgi:hypothetical protein